MFKCSMLLYAILPLLAASSSSLGLAQGQPDMETLVKNPVLREKLEAPVNKELGVTAKVKEGLVFILDSRRRDLRVRANSGRHGSLI